MKKHKWWHMVQCNKNGIRIYPVLKYGYYYLEIEFNRSSDFDRHEIIRTRRGEVRYDANKKEWGEKVLELYEHLYKTKVMPKLGVV